MHRNGLLRLEALLKVIPFQNLTHRVPAAQRNEPFGAQLGHPAAVEIDHRCFRVEDLEDLLLVGFRIGIDFFSGQLLSSGRSTGRIADQTCEVADQEDDRMPEILKVLHLADQDCVPQMDVRCGRIETGFHLQGPTCLLRLPQAFNEVFGTDDLDNSLGQVGQLFIEGERLEVLARAPLIHPRLPDARGFRTVHQEPCR